MRYDRRDALLAGPGGWKTAGRVFAGALVALFVVTGLFIFNAALPVIEARMDGEIIPVDRDAVADEQRRSAHFEQEQAS